MAPARSADAQRVGIARSWSAGYIRNIRGIWDSPLGAGRRFCSAQPGEHFTNEARRVGKGGRGVDVFGTEFVTPCPRGKAPPRGHGVTETASNPTFGATFAHPTEFRASIGALRREGALLARTDPGLRARLHAARNAVAESVVAGTAGRHRDHTPVMRLHVTRRMMRKPVQRGVSIISGRRRRKPGIAVGWRR
jgi:hypothetical protein